jgi:hypothetical protein
MPWRRAGRKMDFLRTSPGSVKGKSSNVPVHVLAAYL